VLEVLLDLDPYVIVRRARQVVAKHRLAAAAPVAALDLSEPFDQLLDPSADLLAIRASRETRHEPADLVRAETPPVTEEHHRSASRGEAAEHVSRDPL
jgi:hypothetical protein